MTSADISDEQVLQSFPEVRLDHRNKEFYRALLGHQLVAARCRDCGTWHTPLRSLCPECWSDRRRRSRPSAGAAGSIC